jgi:hypothetical protein
MMPTGGNQRAVGMTTKRGAWCGSFNEAVVKCGQDKWRVGRERANAQQSEMACGEMCGPEVQLGPVHCSVEGGEHELE